MASMGLTPKDAIAFARLHCIPTKGICQHLAQKIIFILGRLTKLRRGNIIHAMSKGVHQRYFFASVNAFAHFFNQY